MSWLEVIGVCLGFGIILLTLSCRLGAELAGVSPFRVCQLCCKLAVLQFALFMGGWLVGVQATSHVARWAQWANAMLLALVAVRAFWMRGTDSGQGEMPNVEEAVRVLRGASDTKLLVLVWGFVLASLVTRACCIGLTGGVVASVLSGVGILVGYRFGIHGSRGAEWGSACIFLLVVVYNFLWPA